ncbi:MAG: VOC family protein [Dehalococcoidia bacterium]
MGDSSPIVYFQIGATDAGEMAAFCRDVFGWDIGATNGPVTALDTGAGQVVPNDIFVSGSIRQLAEGASSFVSLYVRVSDLDGAVERAMARGAQLVVPRRDPEGGASVAVVRGPGGVAFGIVQL